MQRRLAQFFLDMVEASDHILAFTAGMDRAGYEQNYLVQSAVERQFITIGEAMAQVRHEYPAILAHLVETHQIIAFRHVLVHEYRNIDDDDVWSVVEKKLTVFRAQVSALLEQAEKNQLSES